MKIIILSSSAPYLSKFVEFRASTVKIKDARRRTQRHSNSCGKKGRNAKSKN